MAVGLGGGAVGVEFHRLEVAVERHAHVALLAVGIAAQVVGHGERFAARCLVLDNFIGGRECLFSLAAGEHIFDFLYGFHLDSILWGKITPSS